MGHASAEVVAEFAGLRCALSEPRIWGSSSWPAPFWRRAQVAVSSVRRCLSASVSGWGPWRKMMMNVFIVGWLATERVPAGWAGSPISGKRAEETCQKEHLPYLKKTRDWQITFTVNVDDCVRRKCLLRN
jgi:hypothetical protein